jgi:serine/threonine protein kinase/tetratricopeptide (TPR) repeat protein
MRQCLLCSRQYDDPVQFCPHDGTALPPPDQLVGKVIDGKYRIDALQGSGGMGAVYRATQVQLERTVALKVVRGDFISDAVVAERFKREALAVARLKHPHIVTIYDFGLMDEGGAYLVMEFLEGQTLRAEIQKRERLPVGPAVELMRQVCSAVHAAHVEGVIHRDLKPDNIFLERGRDGSLVVKILDFGVAKLRQNTSELKGQAELTMSGMMLGTPIYMSPEQCQGEPLDPRSDIYSLGCVFYEMLAGRPPFVGSTATQLIIKHASVEPKPPSAYAPGLPYDLEAVVLRALAKAPEDRFQTAADFGDALGEIFVPLDTQVSFPVVGEGTSALDTGSRGEMENLVDQLFPVIDDDARQRVAVLPFKNLRNDESVEFLSFALADNIITDLSGEPGLVVRPSSAIESYAGAAIDQREVSRKLDVELLVIGNFLKQGNTLQLNAQLVDVAGNEIVWRDRITTPCDDLFALQDTIVQQVVAGVRAKLVRASSSSPLSSSPLPATATPASGLTGLIQSASTPVPIGPVLTPVFDPVSLDLLAKAGELGEGATDRQQAIEMLERAVALDPDLAAAWSALASRYYSARDEIGRGPEFTQKAIAAAERALLLDRNELGSGVALGRLLVEAGKVEDVARRAVTILAEQPTLFAPRFALAYACRFGGLLDRALRELRTAAQSSDEQTPQEVATIYLQKQLYTDALRVLDDASAGGWRPVSLFVAAVAWTLVGDAAGTRDVVGELSKVAPSSVYTLMGQVLVAKLENRNVGGLLNWLREVETGNGEVHYWLAQIHAHAGDVPGAVARLRSAVAGGYFNHPYFASDPLLAAVRAANDATPVLEGARLRHEQFAREFGAWTTQP